MTESSDRSDRIRKDEAPAAGLNAATGREPYTHPVDANLGAARTEEHAAPAPTTRVRGKLWAIAGLVIVASAAVLLTSI
ncbi:MAG: hypothetical protein RLO51_10700 [Thalassobaculum sp.]|uniref:hypothetical protein n=1 Tax=Thalassobaculum sp. TaxID=2022740 RepID=UPI0032EBD6BE